MTTDVPTVLTCEQAETVAFDTVRRGGYNTGQVDTFVAMTVQALAAHENAPEPTPEAATTTTAVDDAAVAPPVEDRTARAHSRVADMLAEASQAVSDMLADAHRDSDQLRTQAHTDADAIIAAAHTTANTILADADLRHHDLETAITALETAKATLLEDLNTLVGAAQKVASQFDVDQPQLPAAQAATAGE